MMANPRTVNNANSAQKRMPARWRLKKSLSRSARFMFCRAFPWASEPRQGCEPDKGKRQLREEQGQRHGEGHLAHGIAQSERGEEHQDGPRDSHGARVKAEPPMLKDQRER